jgi:hypothetical protein
MCTRVLYWCAVNQQRPLGQSGVALFLGRDEMRPRAGAGLVAPVRGCDLAVRHVYAHNPALVRSRSGWNLGGLVAALAPYWGCFFPPVASAASKPKKGGQPGP